MRKRLVLLSLSFLETEIRLPIKVESIKLQRLKSIIVSKQVGAQSIITVFNSSEIFKVARSFKMEMMQTSSILFNEIFFIFNSQIYPLTKCKLISTNKMKF